MSTVKVLICGGIQDNFMNQLTTGIKQFSRMKINFNILYEHSINKDAYKNIDHFIEYKTKSSYFKRIKFFFKLIFKKDIFPELFLELRVRGIKFIPFFFKERILAMIFSQNIDTENYDIIHFQYLYKNHFINYLSKKQNIICSVWGSDLYRNSGLYSYYFQSKILNKVNRISIHSIEMREVLLAKFGRSLQNKIQLALFPSEEKLYNQIKQHQNNKELKTIFKKAYNIPLNKTIIAIGHNAKKENGHIEILKQIIKLDPFYKGNVVCVFLLTYASQNKVEYVNEIETFCSDNDINCITFTDYLSIEDLCSLKLITDILIHTPISDAMSGFVTEAMYAGSVLITGSWLPYGTFRRAGLDYKEIEAIEDVSPLLSKILTDGIEKHKPNIEKQQKAIEQKFFPERTSKMWINIYNDVLKKN